MQIEWKTRLCTVNDKLGYFHAWEHYSKPLEVLMDHYWTKTYAKRIPRFTELVLDYYERWHNGELDMDKLKEDLWEYGGVKLVEGEGETA